MQNFTNAKFATYITGQFQACIYTCRLLAVFAGKKRLVALLVA